jgi:hypothetical protein
MTWTPEFLILIDRFLSERRKTIDDRQKDREVLSTELLEELRLGILWQGLGIGIVRQQFDPSAARAAAHTTEEQVTTALAVQQLEESRSPSRRIR